MTLTPQEKAQRVAQLEAMIALVQAIPERRQCPECLNFQGGYCHKWDDQVPSNVQSTGCDEWQGLPF